MPQRAVTKELIHLSTSRLTTPSILPTSRGSSGSSTLVKKEEGDPNSPNYVGILRHRHHRRYDFRDVPNVKKELDDAKAADLEYERNIDILKRHIVALRRECETLARERNAARREYQTMKSERDAAQGDLTTYMAKNGDIGALRKECERLTRERHAADLLASQNETAQLQALLQRYQTINGDTEAVIQTYRAEKNDIEAHVKQYNPEIIERQEELLVDPEMPQGCDALPPNPSSSLASSVPVMRMRQRLSHLGVRRRPTSHTLSGSQRLSQFRQWLQSRPLLSSAEKGAPYNASAVFMSVDLPALPMPASRSCKAPPLFIGQLYHFTNNKKLGLVLCPDYMYVPSATYAQRIWSRADQWHACGEQEREVFYYYAREVHYAGTYVCHTGPGRLKVQDMSKMGMSMEEMVTRLESATAGGELPQEERNAVLALYLEGSLTVNVLGLERVDFNDTLYSYLHVAYEQQREAVRVAEAQAQAQKKAKKPKKTKAQKKAERAAAQAAQQAFSYFPPPPLSVPPPLPVLPPPSDPHTSGFHPLFTVSPYQFSHTPPFGAATGNRSVPLPYLAPARSPSPPRRAPSELEYVDNEYADSAFPVKREREDDEYLLDDDRDYKVAKLEDMEDEERVDDKLRVHTEEPEDQYGHSWNRDRSEDNFEPYMGFKNEED
ncbi:hypothetical protein K466DRAFT_605987 [Polyporus arcularius HHB13444]|uniref:Uncharacterized protein n=1 Tax=Polyporus arcularius HHB13444 TaxID=1314778 RepID=A0A5C3NSC3_9APHY|nr:hypothetical protein K466DRAFT_605987 [Polyporus arcularius HHB13444]